MRPEPIGTIGKRCSGQACELIALNIRTRILDDGPQAVIVREGSVFAHPAASRAGAEAINRNPMHLVGVYTVAATRRQIAGDIRETLRTARRAA